MNTKQPFQRPTRLEEAYARELNRLFTLYLKLPTTTTLGEINARLVEYGQASNFIQRFAPGIVERMITQTLNNNATSWRKAATDSSKGRVIYSMLKSELNGSLQMQVDAIVRDNAKLIKTAPQRISTVLLQHIQQRQMEGVRSEQIVKEIQKRLPHLQRYEVRRIARTEVAKADTAVTRVRAQSIGLNWYVWETSEDQRVRPAHKLMDRVLINWGDAPAPEQLAHEKSQGHYHAGNIWNCRCVALPLVRMDEISYPVKVYTGGRIKRLTRKQFALISQETLELVA